MADAADRPPTPARPDERPTHIFAWSGATRTMCGIPQTSDQCLPYFGLRWLPRYRHLVLCPDCEREL